MSGDHNMYCSGNQPDIVERLRETSAEIVKDTLPRWKNLDEYMDEAADEIERLRALCASQQANDVQCLGNNAE